MLQPNVTIRLHNLSLQETSCKPILTYAVVVIRLTVEQLRIWNSFWNIVYSKIFGFNKWESVSTFISGLGRLDLCNIYLLLQLAKFYKHLRIVRNGTLNEPYRSFVVKRNINLTLDFPLRSFLTD